LARITRGPHGSAFALETLAAQFPLGAPTQYGGLAALSGTSSPSMRNTISLFGSSRSLFVGTTTLTRSLGCSRKNGVSLTRAPARSIS